MTTKAQTNTCPLFGTDEGSHTRSREERIFLNFEAPSQCRGNVTSWRYCFYDSENDDADDDDASYGAKLIVYRRSSATSNDYVPVSGSITTIQLTSGISSNFRCRSATVAQRFEIQENDVIAACIWDQGDVHPLYLVGDTNNRNAAQELYQYDRRSYDDCTSSQINTVDTSHRDFRRREEYRLHLYANIGMFTRENIL